MSTLILFYHSVKKNIDRRIDPSIVVSPKNFEWQLAYFASTRQVISLDEYVDALYSGRSLPSKNVIITFDDGYKDNFTVVYPLLKKYRLPATFFLATGYMDGTPKWEDQISFAVFNTSVKVMKIALDNGCVSFRLSSEQQRTRAMNSLIKWMLSLSPDAQTAALNQIYGQCGLSLDDYPSEPTMMNWEDVRQMASTTGISFGCHTMTHRRLSLLSDEELEREIRMSKQKLEAELGRRVRSFSYPYGTLNDYDDRTLVCLRSSGFDCALTTRYRQNGPHSDPYQLGRVVGANTSLFRFRFGNFVRGSQLGEGIRLLVNQVRGAV